MLGQALARAQGDEHYAHDGILDQDPAGDLFIVEIVESVDVQLLHISRMPSGGHCGYDLSHRSYKIIASPNKSSESFACSPGPRTLPGSHANWDHVAHAADRPHSIREKFRTHSRLETGMHAMQQGLIVFRAVGAIADCS